MLDTTAVDAAVEELLTQAGETETEEAAATTIIENLATAIDTAVLAALEKDKAANQETMRVVSETIRGVTNRFKLAEDKLGAAIRLNIPPA